MSLTHKQAIDIIEKIYPKFNEVAKRSQTGVDLTGLCIGMDDENNKDKYSAMLNDHSLNDDQNGYYLRNIFAVVCMHHNEISDEQKQQFLDACEEVIGRKPDDTDFRFQKILSVTNH